MKPPPIFAPYNTLLALCLTVMVLSCTASTSEVSRKKQAVQIAITPKAASKSGEQLRVRYRGIGEHMNVGSYRMGPIRQSWSALLTGYSFALRHQKELWRCNCQYHSTKNRLRCQVSSSTKRPSFTLTLNEHAVGRVDSEGLELQVRGISLAASTKTKDRYLQRGSIIYDKKDISTYDLVDQKGHIWMSSQVNFNKQVVWMKHPRHGKKLPLLALGAALEVYQNLD